MKTGIILILSFLLSSALFAREAQELEGTFTETGGLNTYDVNLQNDEGHVWRGTASLVDPTTLLVDVTDGEGDAYRGYAEHNEIDQFDLYLKNPETGWRTIGTADPDDF